MDNYKKEVRECLKCECFAQGCEKKCPFELQEDYEERPSLRQRRRKMNAEKRLAYEKACLKLNSARRKDAEETGGKKQKRQPKKEVDKELAELEKEYDKKIEEQYDADIKHHKEPKYLFRARLDAIKQAKRRLERVAKNRSNTGILKK